MVLIGLYGCSPAIRAYYYYDKDDQIQKYKTFNWEIEKKAGLEINLLYDDTLTDSKIKSAVNDLLRVKGYLISEVDADISLHYHVEMEERSIFWPDTCILITLCAPDQTYVLTGRVH